MRLEIGTECDVLTKGNRAIRQLNYKSWSEKRQTLAKFEKC